MQVKSIVQTLLEALPTPSYSVQEAVSGCLSPLMQGLSSDKEYVQSLAQRLLDSALTGPDYPHRHALHDALHAALHAVLHAVLRPVWLRSVLLCCSACCAALHDVRLLAAFGSTCVHACKGQSHRENAW